MRNNIFGIIAILFAVLIVLTVAAIAAYQFLNQPEVPESGTAFENPTYVLDEQQIDPALAISLLGGIAPADMVDHAISKSRPGTALATIMFSPVLNSAEAAGDLLLLGRRFAEQGDNLQARISYQLAATLATLSPDLSDTLRADVFTQAGSGLVEVDDPILAKVYLDQAFLVATQSHFLQAAYRRAILEQVSKAYRDIGLREESRRSLDLSLNPADLEPLSEQPLILPTGRNVPLSEEIQQAEAARWTQAQMVVKDLVEMGGVVKPENLAALQTALLQEDALKRTYFDQAIANEPQLSGKANLLQAKIDWQSIKYRIARRGFGLSLVPEWEENAELIRSELTSSYEALNRLYNDMIVAMPDASQIDRATEEAVRRQILAGQLGQYPNYPAEQLKSQLLNITAKLAANQPGTKLRVSYLTINGVDYYVLLSDDTILAEE